MYKHTFGKDRCAEALVEILNKNPKNIQKHVSQILNKYIHELEQLKDVSDKRLKIQWLQRIRQYYRIKLNNFDLEIKQFTDCVMAAIYKNKLRLWQPLSKNVVKRGLNARKNLSRTE